MTEDETGLLPEEEIELSAPEDDLELSTKELDLAAVEEDLELLPEDELQAPADLEEITLTPEEEMQAVVEEEVGLEQEEEIELDVAEEVDLEVEDVDADMEALFDADEDAFDRGPEEAAVKSAAPLWQELMQEARERSLELTDCLQALSQETNSFFERLSGVIAGKPSLEKVAGYFSSVHKNLEEKFSHARNLHKTLHRLIDSVRGIAPALGSTAPSAAEGADVAAQLEQIQQTLKDLTEAVARLERAKSAPAHEESAEEAPAAAADNEAFETAELELTETLAAAEAPEAADDLPEDLLELVEEVGPEPLRPAPPSIATIYLANVAGNTLGLPVDSVVSTYKVSKGKAKSLAKRGYVTLKDFKAPFRSIKRGLTGTLASMSKKKLKDIQFPIINLSPEVLGSEDSTSQLVRGVVLFCNDDYHGALFTDEVVERRPYEVFGFRKAGLPGEVCGTATIEGDFEINVLNIDRLLS
ncbi:MAG: hypothetical protein JRJ12_17035 [Deltaproteobacteria bacterium]|nr:hypothetical protein [Deltaproteobacteria bacterium]